jgi:hypothetical protein
MKSRMFWVLKDNQQKKYTDKVALVISKDHNAVKLMRSDGVAIVDLAENWKLVSGAQ